VNSVNSGVNVTKIVYIIQCRKTYSIKAFKIGIVILQSFWNGSDKGDWFAKNADFLLLGLIGCDGNVQ